MFSNEKSLILSLIQLDLKNCLNVIDAQQIDKLKICNFNSQLLKHKLEKMYSGMMVVKTNNILNTERNNNQKSYREK